MIRRLSKGPGIPADALIAKTAAKQSANAELGFRGEQRCHGVICSGEKDAPPLMTEKHAAERRQVSLKALRRRRLDGEGPARRRDALKRQGAKARRNGGNGQKKNQPRAVGFLNRGGGGGNRTPVRKSYSVCATCLVDLLNVARHLPVDRLLVRHPHLV